VLAILGRERGENFENILSRDQDNLEVRICSAKCHAQTDTVSVQEFDVEQGHVDLSRKDEEPGVRGALCCNNDIDVGDIVEGGLEEVSIELVVFNDGNTNGGMIHTVIIPEAVSVFTPNLRGEAFLTQWAQTSLTESWLSCLLRLPPRKSAHGPSSAESCWLSPLYSHPWHWLPTGPPSRWTIPSGLSTLLVRSPRIPKSKSW
jgi:hypothetical protein